MPCRSTARPAKTHQWPPQGRHGPLCKSAQDDHPHRDLFGRTWNFNDEWILRSNDAHQIGSSLYQQEIKSDELLAQPTLWSDLCLYRDIDLLIGYTLFENRLDLVIYINSVQTTEVCSVPLPPPHAASIIDVSSRPRVPAGHRGEAFPPAIKR